MTLRSFQRRRGLGWLALCAMLLLAFAPTVSQVRAAHASRHDHSAMAGVHAGHAAHYRADRHGDESARDGADDWRQCGYCDFLAHSPVLGAAVPSLLVTALAPAVPASPRWSQPRPASRFPAAQPRGPPVLA